MSLKTYYRHMIGGALGVVCTWAVANAHPIHTTMSTITVENGLVTMRIRAFADDLSASVAVFAGKKAPADWSMVASDVARYTEHTVHITDATGAALAVTSCGVTREREVYWLCVRVDNAKTVAGLHLANRMLVERHEDQVNIVQVKTESSRRTLLFTKGADAKAMS